MFFVLLQPTQSFLSFEDNRAMGIDGIKDIIEVKVLQYLIPKISSHVYIVYFAVYVKLLLIRFSHAEQDEIYPDCPQHYEMRLPTNIRQRSDRSCNWTFAGIYFTLFYFVIQVHGL